jgi:hypothetical protein
MSTNETNRSRWHQYIWGSISGPWINCSTFLTDLRREITLRRSHYSLPRRPRQFILTNSRFVRKRRRGEKKRGRGERGGKKTEERENRGERRERREEREERERGERERGERGEREEREEREERRERGERKERGERGRRRVCVKPIKKNKQSNKKTNFSPLIIVLYYFILSLFLPFPITGESAEAGSRLQATWPGSDGLQQGRGWGVFMACSDDPPRVRLVYSFGNPYYKC